MMNGKYKALIYDRFTDAIDNYSLINNGDRVAVCISGGKDSMLLALFFMEYSSVQNEAAFNSATLLQHFGVYDAVKALKVYCILEM